MAAILKFPSKISKGVLSVTNLDIKFNKRIKNLKELKKKWVLLYHPNYYDYNFHNRNIFDGFLAWEETFKIADEKNPKILNLTCHNFAPDHFIKKKSYKYYDFVGLSRWQNKSGNPKQVVEFLQIIKETFKLKKDLRGILIISVPGIRPFVTNHIRSIYKKFFSLEERKQFDFITLDYDVPNALSTYTIGMIYNNSKIHLNLHPKERHGRAQAYAIANKIPIVGYKNLTYLVKKHFRKEPIYFVANGLKQFPSKIIKAINYVDRNYLEKNHELISRNFLSKYSYPQLKKKLKKMYKLDNKNWNFKDDWDLRLAKHHYGYDSNNSYLQNLDDLTDYLLNNKLNAKIYEEDLNKIYISKKNFFVLNLQKIFHILKKKIFQIKILKYIKL